MISAETVRYIASIDREIAALREENARLRAVLLLRGISPAPCDICGYSGPGYYQPQQHKCIAAADRTKATLAPEVKP